MRHVVGNLLWLHLIPRLKLESNQAQSLHALILCHSPLLADLAAEMVPAPLRLGLTHNAKCCVRTVVLNIIIGMYIRTVVTCDYPILRRNIPPASWKVTLRYDLCAGSSAIWWSHRGERRGGFDTRSLVLAYRRTREGTRQCGRCL